MFRFLLVTLLVTFGASAQLRVTVPKPGKLTIRAKDFKRTINIHQQRTFRKVTGKARVVYKASGCAQFKRKVRAPRKLDIKVPCLRTQTQIITVPPRIDYEVSLNLELISNDPYSITLTSTPSNFQVKSVNPLILYGDKELDDSLKFKIVQGSYVSDEFSLILRAARNGSDILSVSPPPPADLTFEEVFHKMTFRSLKMQEDPLLNSGGLLTKFRGASLMGARDRYNELKSRFESDKLGFIGSLTASDARDILFKSQKVDVTTSPVRLFAVNGFYKHHLGAINQRLIHKAFNIQLNCVTGEKFGAWSPSTVGAGLRQETFRGLTVALKVGCGGENLDILRDVNGTEIKKPSGAPHRFPLYNEWAERVRTNLPPVLNAIKEALGDSELHLVAIDFESVSNDYQTMKVFFGGEHAKLLLDPRTPGLLRELDFTEEDILDFENLSAEKQLRWDALMIQKRADAISRAIGDSMRGVFNDLLISNYNDTLRTDLVPNGNHYYKDFRTWGSTGTRMINYMPSFPLYALHYWRLSTPEGEILSNPPVPKVLNARTETEYYTPHHTFSRNLNRVNSTSSATNLRTNHFVTEPEFINYYHVNNSFYDYYGPPSSRHGIAPGLMAEYWILAAQNSEYLNLYTPSYYAQQITKPMAERALRWMQIINRAIGYSDRSVSKDAYVYIDGRRTAVSPSFQPYGEPFYLWASRANNREAIRVVFMAEEGFDKAGTIVNSSEGVTFNLKGKTLYIPNATLDEESLNDETFGVWVYQES